MIKIGATYTLNVHNELGRGHFGCVFRTTLEGLPGDYATKFFPKANTDPSKYFNEAAKLLNAKHPNVVNFVWTAESECPDSPNGQMTHIQIVLEFYSRGSVDKAVPLHGMTVGDARHVTSECLKGLACSHARSILHLDVKPNNLLYRSDGGVVISDFGQALVANPQTGLASSQGHLMYSVHRPPETVLSPASDLWQVGLTLYRLLTGMTAQALLPLVQAGKGTLRDRLARPLHCPSTLWTVIRKLLAPRPEDRYTDCVETLAAISRINQLIDWKLESHTADEWLWSGHTEKIRAWNSPKGWEVEYTKNDRRVNKICPKSPPTTEPLALAKVDACFRLLEKQPKKP